MIDNNIQVYIDKQIKTFNITDLAITELKDKYLPLKIESLEDKEAYKAVVEARRDVKKRRVDVEKKRKELKEDAVIYGRAIDGEAKRITLHLEEIENYLLSQENFFESEKERIKQEKIESEKQLFLERTLKLNEIGFHYDSVDFKANRDGWVSCIIGSYVRETDEAGFNSLLAEHTEKHLQELKRLKLIKKAQEEEQQKLEAERQEEEAKKAEALRIEKEELEKIRTTIEAENERIKKERAEKQAEIDKLTKQIEEARKEKLEFRVGLLNNLGITFEARMNGFTAPFFSGDYLSVYELQRLSDSEFTQILKNYEDASNSYEEKLKTLEVAQQVSEKIIEAESEMIDEKIEKVDNHDIGNDELNLEILILDAQKSIKDICASILVCYGLKPEGLVVNVGDTKWNIEHNGYRLFSCNIGEYIKQTCEK